VADINDLSVTDASNTARFPEGMARASVNNAARALEGIIARWDKDTNGSLATGGTSTAITVTLNRSSIAAWYDGLYIFARVTTTCGATPTLNPTGSGALGAKSLYWPDGTQLAANDIVAGGVYGFFYELTSDKVYVIGAKPTVTMTGGDGITVTSGDIDFVPSELADVALATGDQVVIADASDSNNPKTATASDFQSLFAAVQADQETGTSTTTNVTPGVQHFHPSAAKCWGYVTVTTGTPTLVVSYNVTSIADNDVGEVTVNIGTDISSANYAALVNTAGAESTGINGGEEFASRAAGSFVAINTNEAGTFSDPESYSFAVYGDLA
jgi:hypothetical protein